MSASEQPASLSVGEDVTVLHVDDDPDVLEVTAAYLERAGEGLEVVTARGATEGLERLADRDVDCVVSDYQMPAMDGLEFLDAVRESYPDIPFILFTGKGSEEIASEAISAGVTDYLQKRTGTDQYDILANRVANAVDRNRTAREHARVHQALETATEGIAILDAEGRYVYVNDSYADLYGLSPEDLVGEGWEFLYPEDQVERFHEEILPELENSGEWTGWNRGRRADGSTFVEQLSLTDLSEGGHVCVVRDTTERVEREQALQRERDRASALFEIMAEPIAYYEFGDEEPLVRDLNPAFEETFGVDADEAVGRKLDDHIIPPEHVDEGKRINERVRAGEIVDTKVERLAADGERTFNLLSVPLRPGESGERGFAVYTDITERTERERQLQRERDHYQSLFENTNDAVAWTEYEGETPVIRDANPRFRDLFEPPDVEVVGQPLDEVVTDAENADRRERAEEISREVKSGEPMRGELKRDTVNGPRTFIWEAIPHTPPGAAEVRNTHAVYTDISAQKAYERELEQYRTLVETVGDPMYMLDAEGSITMVNDAVVEQWGYSREEFADMHARDVMPDEDYERGTQIIRELLADEDRTWGSFEMRSITDDGETVVNENKIGVIVEDGEYVGSVGVIRDITDRKERERELEESRERYQSLFENNPLVIWEEDFSGAIPILEEIAAEVDDVESYLRENPREIDRLLSQVEIIDVNQNALAYYDAPSKEALMENLDDLFVEESYDVLAETWAAIAAGETRFRGETVARTLDGEGRNELIDVFVPEAYADDYSRVYVSGTDITERKERERELERKNERLEEFTSVVSHDLRNPLNVAASYTELVADECDSPHIEKVAGAHERMETLIEDLLTLAREGETVAEVKPVDLGGLLSGCWETLDRDGATLAVETDATVRADRDRLRQLVENLLTNALNHGGSDVSVTVGDCEGGFYVADDGPGIPADEREDVFDAGYSTSADGNGFGLSIVARIAEAHGWTVAVTESDDGGARFEITGVEAVE
jgi:PAS domain S-box-containing protein